MIRPPDEVGCKGNEAVDDGDNCGDAADNEKELPESQIRSGQIVLRGFIFLISKELQTEKFY